MLMRGANAIYRGQTIANAALSGALLAGVYKVFGWSSGQPPRAAQRELERRVRELMDQDWANAEAGYYPMRLLFESPLFKHGRQFPSLFIEAPRIAIRRRRRAYDSLPRNVDRTRYPRYYLRTFHWQSDGWFSKRSARMYDASVELLFGGTADIMRRTVIPPLVDAVRHIEHPRILDVACGTGGFLDTIRTALPNARLMGLDLSEPYLEHAADKLGPGVWLDWGHAEKMPYDDDSFDALSCVFLFHELPRAVRREVFSEMKRVVKPGGKIVILDSSQLVESASMKFFLENFPEVYHEPYYRDYLSDDLEAIAEGAGLTVTDSRPFLVSKRVTLTA